jgi:2,5-dihydroxypyridine 5,6-dioxygenase
MSPSLEWRHVAAFVAHFQRCAMTAGEAVVLLSESASRHALVEIARTAAASLGARVVDVVVPTPASDHPVAIRSTGASQALAHHPAALGALRACDMVIDCTVEGLLHAPELGQILESGTRVLMVSNEHPDVFDRIRWDDELPGLVADALGRLRAASVMRVTSASGTDLTVQLAGAFTAGSTGLTDAPGTIAHWPGGLVVAFPAARCVQGRIVMAPGDVNLTFGRYLESRVELTIEDDHIVCIDGPGLDAQLFESYLSAFGDRASRATSHVGWGLNRHARWDALALVDKADAWGTELRAFAGNVLYSTGANEVAQRFTAGHFDLPMRGCTVALDGAVVVDAGRLTD